MKYVTHTEAGEGLIFYGERSFALCRPLPERHRALPRYDDEAGGSGRSMSSELKTDVIINRDALLCAAGASGRKRELLRHKPALLCT